MSFDRERVEMLSAMVASGAASVDEEQELQSLTRAHSEAAEIAKAYQETTAALGSALDRVQPSSMSIDVIKQRIEIHKSQTMEALPAPVAVGRPAKDPESRLRMVVGALVIVTIVVVWIVAARC